MNIFGMGLRLWQLLAQVFTIVGQKQVSLIAAGVAFFGMFAVFPGIAAIIAIFGLLADPIIVSDQLALMASFRPTPMISLPAKLAACFWPVPIRSGGRRFCLSYLHYGRRGQGSRP
jgi:hypothetical protein